MVMVVMVMVMVAYCCYYCSGGDGSGASVIVAGKW